MPEGAEVSCRANLNLGLSDTWLCRLRGAWGPGCGVWLY